ncbi:MAG: imidazole glycerol phosphate synthase subunit HisH [Ferruginibacter sp.]
MTVAIVKYNSGNVQSVQFALQRIGVESIVTDDAAIIREADRVIFPGVGHAASAMAYLREHHIDELMLSLTQPVLGICLGLQLMCNFSEEGETPCLGIFNEPVKLFQSATLKVPQMGWNTIYNLKGDLFHGMDAAAYVYSVHSYYAALGNDTIATTDYIMPYSAALQKDNYYAVQFHPEKSGAMGELILNNFITRL